MKEIFNLSRFWKYITGDLRRCMTAFGPSFIIISLMGVITYTVNALFSLCSGNGWETIGTDGRLIAFVISAMVLVITMPSKCYGHITDRRKGSAFLMLPASAFEKFLSMTINCLVIIPAAFMTVHLGCDWIISTIDKTAGTAIILNSSYSSAFSAVDDIFGIILCFLLGSLYFKRSKAAKTILVMIGAAIALSMVVTPFVVHWYDHKMLEDIIRSIEDIMWVDTIIDITVMCALLAAVYFRVKTIKH